MSRLDLFKFLKEYNEIKNPIVKDINSHKFSLFIGELPNNDYVSTFIDKSDENTNVLVVKKPDRLPCPTPRKEIKEWLNSGWDEVSVEKVRVIPTLERNSENNETSRIEKFDDDSSRVQLFKQWEESRNIWREKEVSKLKAIELYSTLYKLYSDIQKEAESVELILGDGNFYWKHDLNSYHHPIVSQKVVLDFDSTVPKFSVLIEEPRVELNTSILRTIEGLNQGLIAELMEKIDEIGSISDFEFNNEKFSELINRIHVDGKLVNEITRNEVYPVIYSNPVLYLRKKTLGYSEFISNIIQILEAQPDMQLPDFFRNLMGDYQDVIERPEVENWNQSGIDQNVLLTLPANNEQLRILKKLEHYPAVLVQGPPGTGKTHTIANLIGHLLSEGKTVLVTSHTEKALSVLKNKVITELQNLCISLLSSSSQRAEMENALNDINDKRSTFDELGSKKKIAQLESLREKLIEDYRSHFQELKQIRSNEYKDLVYDNSTVRPIDAAKFIGSGIGLFDYIPGNSTDDRISMPFSTIDLQKLYESNGLISAEEETNLIKPWPSIDELWDINLFEEKVIRLSNLEKMTEKSTDTNPKIIEKIELIKSLYSKFEDLGVVAQELDNDIETIISHVLMSETYRSNWNEIFKDTVSLQSSQNEFNELIATNDLDIPDSLANAHGLMVVEQIISAGTEKPVGFFSAGTWKEFKKNVKLNSRIPERLAEFKTIHKILQFKLNHLKISNKVKIQIEELEINTSVMGQSFTNLANFIEKVQRNLEWIDSKFIHAKEQMSELTEIIGRLEFNDVKGYISKSKQILNKLILEFDLNRERNEFYKYLSYMQTFQKDNSEMSQICRAIEQKNLIHYRDVYSAIKQLLNKHQILISRNNLIKQIKSYAPEWADAITKRVGIHAEIKPPENIQDAWKWMQLNSQIKRLDGMDANSIQAKITMTQKEILRNSRELALEKAWSSKISKITAEQNAAITGWKQTLKSIGKGTGKRVAQLRAHAKRLMAQCQTAIPVWIMPLNQVANNFDPRVNQFDVVIIDEASQADMLALPAMYLGKKIIVVGDDQQVSPDAVGQKMDDMDALIRQYLTNIPNGHLFNEKQSIYDLAANGNFSPIVLREHFRCLPEIIEFSNQLSYSGRIKPLRDSSNVVVTPPLVEYRVIGGERGDKKINKEEALHITSLIQAMIKHPKYKNQTIGVISMLGNEQASYIDQLLQNTLEPEAYKNRKILCGTSPQFQGDERDIIFLSLVDSPNESGGPLRIVDPEGNNNMYRKRYNVAASRAKNQLWVVHSLNPDIDLKPNDLRLNLISHARNFSKTDLVVGQAESPFEKEILEALIQRGYTVIPQWKVGAYRIDMVVQSGTNKIAIECDGERYHTEENLVDDMNRQAILERLGWRFIRIRGSKYYADKQSTISQLFTQLEDNDIKPSNSDDESTSKNELILDEIKRMALQIRETGEIHEGEIFATIKEDPIEISSAPVETTQTVSGLVKTPASTEVIEIEKPRTVSTDTGKKPIFDFRNKN
jgi:very-short-patch-repair endonuclease/nucleoside-triphosphatase THEP1